MKNLLRLTPGLSFLPFVVLVALVVMLSAPGAALRNSLLAGPLLILHALVYFGLKSGVVRFKRWKHGLDDDPRAFWRTIYYYGLIYLIVGGGLCWVIRLKQGQALI